MATPGRPVSEFLRKRVEQLVNEGKTKSEISRLTGLTRVTVRRYASDRKKEPKR